MERKNAYAEILRQAVAEESDHEAVALCETLGLSGRLENRDYPKLDEMIKANIRERNFRFTIDGNRFIQAADEAATTSPLHWIAILAASPSAFVMQDPASATIRISKEIWLKGRKSTAVMQLAESGLDVDIVVDRNTSEAVSFEVQVNALSALLEHIKDTRNPVISNPPE